MARSQFQRVIKVSFKLQIFYGNILFWLFDLPLNVKVKESRKFVKIPYCSYPVFFLGNTDCFNAREQWYGKKDIDQKRVSTIR